MAKQRFEAEVPDGTRLGFAEGSDGSVRGLLFDEQTNNLVGQAVFFEVGDDDDFVSSPYLGDPDPPPKRDEEYDEFIAAIAGALALLVIHGGTAAPHVRQWWQDKARPAVRSTRTKVKSKLKRSTRSKKAGDEIVTAELVTRRDTAPDLSNEGAGLDENRPVMSSDEARRRFTDAVMAMAFAQEQMGLLHNARISDDDRPELANTLNELSPERLEETIHSILEAEPLMLERENLEAFKMRLVTGQPAGELGAFEAKTPVELRRLSEDEQ